MQLSFHTWTITKPLRGYGTLRTKMGKPEHNPLGCEAALGQDLVDLVGGEIRVGVVVHPLGQRLTLSGLRNTQRDMDGRAKNYVNNQNVFLPKEKGGNCKNLGKKMGGINANR
jgi:hypothetical protein